MGLGLELRKYLQFTPVGLPFQLAGAYNSLVGGTSSTRPGHPIIEGVQGLLGDETKGFNFGTDSPVPFRRPSGLGGDIAAQQAANFYAKNLARMQQQNIGVINREFGSAGRYASGARLGAITRSQEAAAGQFGDFLSRTALQRYLAERGFDEQAAIVQAQLDAGDTSGVSPETVTVLIIEAIKAGLI